jgi:hypothetical protein
VLIKVECVSSAESLWPRAQSEKSGQEVQSLLSPHITARQHSPFNGIIGNECERERGAFTQTCSRCVVLMCFIITAAAGVHYSQSGLYWSSAIRVNLNLRFAGHQRQRVVLQIAAARSPVSAHKRVELVNSNVHR